MDYRRGSRAKDAWQCYQCRRIVSRQVEREDMGKCATCRRQDEDRRIQARAQNNG